jgi:hypothetical protein
VNTYRELLAQFHASSIETLPPIEFLLEAKGMNAAPGSHHILSVRIVKWPGSSDKEVGTR